MYNRVVLPGNMPGKDGPPITQYDLPNCTPECTKRRGAMREAIDVRISKKKERSIIKKKTTKTKTKVPCIEECVENKKSVVSQIEADERVVFKRACEILKGHWDKKEYNGYPIDCDVVPESLPADVQQLKDKLDAYFGCVDIKKIRTDHKEIHDYFHQILRHTNLRSTHMMSYIAHCGYDDCSHGACHRDMTKMLKVIRAKAMPYCATRNGEHFHTYLEHKKRDGTNQDIPNKWIWLQRKPRPEYQPQLCPFSHLDRENCAARYVFSTEAEKTRHLKLFHPNHRTLSKWWADSVKEAENGEQFVPVKKRNAIFVYCRYILDRNSFCGMRFDNWYQLKKHYDATGHRSEGKQNHIVPGISNPEKKSNKKKQQQRQGQQKQLTTTLNSGGVSKTSRIKDVREDTGNIPSGDVSIESNADAPSCAVKKKKAPKRHYVLSNSTNSKNAIDPDDEVDHVIEDDPVVEDENDIANNTDNDPTQSNVADGEHEDGDDFDVSGSMFKPDYILKARVVDGQTEYLIKWLNYDKLKDLTWESYTKIEQPGLLSLVSEWRERYRTVNAPFDDVIPADLSDDGNDTNANESGAVRLDELWMHVGSYKLLRYDKVAVCEYKPINQVLMDATMLMLSQQIKKFKVQSSVCPLTGYVDVALGYHIQIHYSYQPRSESSCSRTKHWAMSVAQDRASTNKDGNIRQIWFGDSLHNDVTPQIAAEITDLYMHHANTENKVNTDKNIRIIRTVKQKKKVACGYMAIAYAVELGCSFSKSPSDLAEIEFEEDKLADWLLGCLQNRLFVRAPIVHVKKIKNLSNKYLIYKLPQAHITYMKSPVPAEPVESRRNVAIGYGTMNEEEAYIPCAPSQKGRLKSILTTGCVLKFDITKYEPTCATNTVIGEWVVREITKHNVLWVVSLGKCTQRRRARVLADNDCFRIINPPIMRTLDFACTGAYEIKKRRTKSMVIYPVRLARLTNAVFMKSGSYLSQYDIFESECCLNAEDITSTLRFFGEFSSKSSVTFIVDLHDIFPYNAVYESYITLTKLGHVLHDSGGMLMLRNIYKSTLAHMFKKFNVRTESTVTYESQFRLPGSVIHRLKASTATDPIENIPHTILTAVAPTCYVNVEKGPSTATTVVLPAIGNRKVFECYDERVLQWASRQVQCIVGNGNECVGYWLVVKDEFDIGMCVVTHVAHHRCVQQTIGPKVSGDDTDQLKGATLEVINAIKYHYQSSMFAENNWEYYKVSVQLNHKKIPIVVDVCGLSVSYNSKIFMNPNLHLYGILAYGGCKIVLNGEYTEPNGNNLPIVFYTIRDCTRDDKRAEFRRDLQVLPLLWSIKSKPNVKYVPQVFYQCTGDNSPWAVVERMYGTLADGKALEYDDRIELLWHSACALTWLHKQGWIHRDVKPSNFLLSLVGECKVALSDFGLSLNPQGSKVSGNAGTLTYQAPEIVCSHGKKEYGQEVDVYSFGITMWELVYNASRSRVLNCLSQHMKIPVVDCIITDHTVWTPQLSRKYGGEIDTLIESCTAPNPTDRPVMVKVSCLLSDIFKGLSESSRKKRTKSLCKKLF